MPEGMTVPSVAKGTRSPTCMLKAPQHTWSAEPSPGSTSTSWMRSASGCGRRSRTRATTIPSSPSPVIVMSSTARPRSESWSARTSGSPSMGANSRSQESRTFITPSELGQESDVVRPQVAQVVDAVEQKREAVDAEAEREAAPLLGIDAHVAEHLGVHHAAAAQLEPSEGRRVDVVLGRGLGEREVRG